MTETPNVHGPDVSAKIKRLRRISGVFLFLAISGFLPLIFPYGVISQWILLLHIAVGIIAVVPISIILWKHARAVQAKHPARWWNASVWAGVGWAALSVTGLWLVAVGVWGVFVPYRMHVAHAAVGVVLGAVGVYHLFNGLRKCGFAGARYRQLSAPVIVWTCVFVLGAFGIWYARRTPALAAANFRPSNARTTTGQVIPMSLLRGSADCGSAGCHATIYKEWVPGAHHYSSSDPFYAAVKANYIHDRGADSPRYCAGCHEPVPLMAGEQIVAGAQPGSDSGSSCAFCHVLRKLQNRGNANYLVRPPDPYLFESDANPWLRDVSHVLIRLHPEQHDRDYNVKPSETAAFCGTCHKQYINKAENGWGFVQLQDQYDDWKNGPWHTDPRRNLKCQSCHMHLVASDDPARTPQGFIHDHRILASNDYMPGILHLPGAERQEQLVDQWMTGETVIPEIAKVWPRGPILPVQLFTEGTYVPGRPAKVRVLVTNRKLGHAFPTGPLDVIESWLEFRVTDAHGKVIYSTGTLGDHGQIVGKTVEYRAFLLDRNAHHIYTHSLWNVVAASGKRVIPAGGSDTAEFQFTVPRGAVGPLHCDVQLLYRKFNSNSQAQLFPHNPPRIPILEISHDGIEIPLGAKAGQRAAATPSVAAGAR
jgi:hypothetical protein